MALTEQEKEMVRQRIDKESSMRNIFGRGIKPSDLMKKYASMTDEQIRALAEQDVNEQKAKLQQQIEALQQKLNSLE